VAARLGQLIVSGLRCLHGLEVTFEPLTALIGSNGVGKSSTVRAIEFLFGKIDVDELDCTDGLPDQEVSVTGVFVDIPVLWAQRLAPWLSEDGTLAITRTATPTGLDRRQTSWSASRRQVEGFGEIRRLVASGEPVATVIKPAYQRLRARYLDLPVWQSKQQVLAALDAYDEADTSATRVTEVDRTLRFAGSDEFDLTQMIELLVLPALRDAVDDASEGRGSNLARLVELTVRSQMDLQEDLEELAGRAAAEYEHILTAKAADSLDALSRDVTAQLAKFAPGSSVRLSWEPRLPSFAPPGVRARLRESGHEGDIGRQGHGVQRAYVFSLLRAMLHAHQDTDYERRSAVMLIIEEPEVYQHPVRARYVARMLADLANDAEQSTQVVYTTHSPYFVSVDNIQAIRLLRLRDHPTIPSLRATHATSARLDAIANRLEKARSRHGQQWTAEKVAASLPGLLGSDVSEGFFADVVVLVEGEEDAGMLDAAAAAADVDLAAEGIAVVAVRGKDRLRLASVVFGAFAVPTYMVFDTDSVNPESGALNSALTWLAGGERLPNPGTRVTSHWASADPTLRAAVNAEIGATVVTAAFRSAARDMSLPESAEKNGYLVRTAIGTLYSDGYRSQTLDDIVRAVRAVYARPLTR
jgi:putative ATP-dependent endonuclease of the OLD family